MLKLWLQSVRRNQNSFAEELGVTSAAVSSWTRDRSRPPAYARHRIEALTRGAVPVMSWLTAAELVQLNADGGQS